VFFRLEMLGYRVGQGLVERCVPPCQGLPGRQMAEDIGIRAAG
jgi:hypothetical protein